MARRVELGEHANNHWPRYFGWGYFGLICVLTVFAPILLITTNCGG